MASAAIVRADAHTDVRDPRYAWVMLPLAMMMHVGTSPGQTFGVSLFNEPIREALGLSHSMLTGSYLIASLLAAAPLMGIGKLMDRFGIKRVALGLIVMVGVACIAIARVQGIVGLTLAFFMLRAFGQGGLSLAAGNTLGTWFVRRLGLASGIAGVGMSVAIAVTPLVYLQLIEAFGWRGAYTTIGLATWCVLLPIIAIAYRNNTLTEAERAAKSDASASAKSNSGDFELAEAMRTPAYWVAASCTALMGMVCTAVFFNLVPLFEQNGLSESQAAAIFPTVAIAMAAMQIKGGLLADRVPLRWLMAAAMASLAAGVIVIGQAHAMVAGHVAAALIGAGQGLLAVTGNTLWPRYFGRRHLGAIRSSVWTATVAACSAGPFVMGVTLDLTGGYGPSLWLMFALAGGASLAALVAGNRPLRESPLEAMPSAT